MFEGYEKKWGLKASLRYWLYWKWWAVFWGIIGVLRKEHIKFDPDDPIRRRDFISLCHGVACMKVGRYFGPKESFVVQAYMLPTVKQPEIVVDADIGRFSDAARHGKLDEIKVVVNVPKKEKLAEAERVEFHHWWRNRSARKMAHRLLHALRYNKWIKLAALIEWVIVLVLMGTDYVYRGRYTPLLGIIDAGGDFVFWAMFFYWVGTTLRVINHFLAEEPPGAQTIIARIEGAEIVVEESPLVNEVWSNWYSRDDDREIELYREMVKIYGRRRSRNKLTWVLRRLHLLEFKDRVIWKLYNALVDEREDKHSLFTQFYPASWRGRRKREFVGTHVSEGQYRFKLWRIGQ